MKILYLTTRYPCPPLNGEKLRPYNFIKCLQSLGHEVHLFSLTDRPPESVSPICPGDVIYLSRTVSYANSVRGIFSRKPVQVSYFRSAAFKRAIDRAIEANGYDVIICHIIRSAEYVRGINNIPKILDMTDAISLNYSRAAEHIMNDFSIKKLIHAVEKNRVRSYEGEMLGLFDKCILISSHEKTYLGKYFDVGNVEVIQNGVDLDYFSFYSEDYDRDAIVIFGNMGYLPNSDAALYYGRDIFPFVKKEVPSAKLLIVGSRPSRKILSLAEKDPAVKVAGFVDDIRSVLYSSAVSVAPMRYGAGLQNKILESMAAGTPVVSTPIGLEGIDAVHGREIMVEESPEGLARRTVELMKDDSLRKHIASAARTLVERHYNWGNVSEKLRVLLENVVARD